MLVESIIIACAAITIIYVYLSRNFNYWKKQSIPFDKPLPFFGCRKNLFLFKCHECIDTDRIYNKFYDQPYVGLFEGDEPVLLVKDPQLVKEFFVNELNMPFERRMREDENSSVTRSFLFASGIRWKKQRAMFTPAFTSARIRTILPILEYNMNTLLQLLATNVNKPVDISVIVHYFTMDVMTSWIYGVNINCLINPANLFRQKFLEVMGTGKLLYLSRLMAWFLQSLAKPLGLSFPSKSVNEFMNKFAKRSVTSRERSGQYVNDMLQILVDAKGQEVVPACDGQQAKLMTMDLIGANAFTLLVAGSDSTSSVISFCLLELALNPDIQERLYSEIIGEVEDVNKPITYYSLLKMKYLDMVVAETLRKWPIAVAAGRVASAPCTLPGTNVFLKPGTGILIPVWSIHRDPKFYPEPERFDPERFSAASKAQQEPYTYIPFAEGSHICIGMRLGLLTVKFAVASIITEFVVDICEKTITPAELCPTSFLLTQKGGTWLKFRKRTV